MKTLITTSITKAASFIKKGEVVAFPTETVYGLGANAYDEKAVRKIFKAKGRPEDNPLIVHVTSKKDIYVLSYDVTDTAKKIIKKFFPGPVTVILKKNEIVPDVVTAGLDTIAIRMPSLKLTRDFIKACGVPIAAPSANISGSPSPTSFIHVLQDFEGRIPCVLVGPDAKFGLESTVVDCTVNPPVILRPGVITLEQLKQVDKKIRVAPKSARVKSPGQKYRHYAPEARLKIIKNYVPRSAEPLKITNAKGKKAYIGIRNLPADLRSKFVRYYFAKDLNDYAKKLFAFFRVCDALGVKTIYAGAVSEKGIGLAIMNRLLKAIKN
ncbi:MAG TPA: L-threonylcarbamoyladenylate synthase [Ignavibacteria bacterium]